MRVKSYSLMMGYKVFEGKIDMSVIPPAVTLEGHGRVSPNDFIRNQFYILEATPREIHDLKQAGYQVRIDTHSS